MKHKNISFSILKEIEKKKIEKDLINIKYLFLKKNKNDQQLKLLINYQKEYLKNINNKIKSGICIHEWKCYNNFIFLLKVIIRDNINIIKKNQMKIEDSLKIWTQKKIQCKIWTYLNKKNEREISKTKKIQAQTFNDHYTQLKMLTKG